jgi:hypothetical protein
LREIALGGNRQSDEPGQQDTEHPGVTPHRDLLFGGTETGRSAGKSGGRTGFGPGLGKLYSG